LFEAARLLSPSVVFFDEVDALVGSRGEQGEHEASRRLKTEIFSQMDGISSGRISSDSSSGSSDSLENNNTGTGKDTGTAGKNGNIGVMVLATTNCPWDLDDALRRRLEKRIFIPMPDMVARHELISICLRNIEIDDDGK
jgi:katanin p60 ATPase-containing subunit A1